MTTNPPQVAGRCANRICKGGIPMKGVTLLDVILFWIQGGESDRGFFLKSWFDQFVHFAVAYLHLKPMCFALTWSEIAYCLSSSAGCIRCVQQMDSQFFFDLSNNRVINTFPIYISPSKLLNITESNPFFQSKTYAEQQNKTHERLTAVHPVKTGVTSGASL